MELGFCQAFLLLTFVVASCAIVPTRLLRGGVGGSVTAIAVGVVAGGVVGAGGGIETINILGAVGGVAVANRAISVHHYYQFLSFCCLYYNTQKGVCQPLFTNFLIQLQSILRHRISAVF